MLKGIKKEKVIPREDGKVEIGDLFEYIKPQVERIARKQYNNEQTPQLFGENPGDIYKKNTVDISPACISFRLSCCG